MADDAGSGLRPGPVGRRLDDPARDVLARHPAGPRAFEQEGFTAVDREGLDGDQRLVKSGLGRGKLGALDERFRPAGGEESEHVSTVSRDRSEGKDRFGISSAPAEIAADLLRGGEEAVGRR